MPRRSTAISQATRRSFRLGRNISPKQLHLRMTEGVTTTMMTEIEGEEDVTRTTSSRRNLRDEVATMTWICRLLPATTMTDEDDAGAMRKTRIAVAGEGTTKTIVHDADDATTISTTTTDEAGGVDATTTTDHDDAGATTISKTMIAQAEVEVADETMITTTNHRRDDAGGELFRSCAT